MLDKAFLKFTKPFVDAVALRLSKQGVVADQLTFIGFGLGMVAAGLIILSYPMLAIVPIVLGRMCDGLDGAVARITHSQTDRGAFLDIALDFVFYASVPLAFVVADPLHNATAGAVLLAAFITTGTSFLAYAAIAAKRGEQSTDYPTKGIYYLGGLTEGSETIALFLAFCIWPQAFSPLAYVYAILCIFTTITRIWAGWITFR